MYPVSLAISIPPIAPAMPPNPTTDPTAWRGNVSDASVQRFADHPWCAAAASPTSATATQSSVADDASEIGTTASAQTSMAVLRPALMLQPRLINVDESQPPPMLPTSAMR